MARSGKRGATAKSGQKDAGRLINSETLSENESPSLSRWLVVLGWIAMLVFACHACTHMVAAGDTWVAMACGRHFVNHGVDTVEPFSANSHHAGPTTEEIQQWPSWAQSIADRVGLDTLRYWHPTGWVNQNWLTHVIFHWLTTTVGSTEAPCFDALVFWKFALYILTVFCVYAIGRTMAVHPTLCAAGACFALFVARSFLDIRPAGFSNLLVPVFVLILSLTSYRKVWYIWLIVPLTVFWCNVHGGYLYVFIMLVPFWGLNLLCLPFPRFCRSIGRKGLYHTLGAGVTALIAMIIFNPFHLTNLTHTFVISLSKHAERWRRVREWHPAFEWDNPVGTAVPFLILYILAWLALVTWFVVQWRGARVVKAHQPKRRKARDAAKDQQSKIRVPLLVIAALTIYMAIRSRRFIPIAAFAACPFLALLIHEIIQSLTWIRGFKQPHAGLVPTMSPSIKRGILGLVSAFVLTFSVWAGLKYQRIYLSPCSQDPEYASVFMRMTASYQKPFKACAFMRLNKLRGRMMNYWTEGGFIAWGQDPDPNTGKIPLQLFMDGRAQAAYDRPAFDRWSYIWAGGDVARELMARQRKPTPEDYKRMGKWLDQTLKARGVWVALVPAKEFQSDLYWALVYDPNWRIVFFNNKQKMFVDLSTDQGQKLFAGIKTGDTVYPDEFTRQLNLAHFHLVYDSAEGAKEKGLVHAIKAFRENPSPAPLLEIVQIAARYPNLEQAILRFCEESVQDFEAHKSEYVKQHGYRARLESARLICAYLQNIAVDQKNTQAAIMYTEKVKEYMAVLQRQAYQMNW